MDNPLKFRLADIHDPSAPDMFPQEHAEIWRSHGSVFICIRQINERKRCVCTDQQPFLSVRRFDREQQFIVLRLGDLCDSSVYQFSSEFVDKVCHDNSVKSHDL